MRFGPKWNPSFPVEIPASRVAAIEAAQMVPADVKVFSDGSGIEGGIGAAAVMYRDSKMNQVFRKYQGSEGQHIVFKVEVISIALAAKLIRVEGSVRNENL